MKSLTFATIIFLTLSCNVFAASSSVSLDTFPSNRLNNTASLQNGAKLYFNYCLGCHGISQVRYSRLKDLGLSESQIKQNFFRNSSLASIASTIISPMKGDDAKAWLGKVPPDLSLTARSRSSHAGTGADWIYTYLRSYYVDSTQRTGWNNLVYPGVGMPNVLWELQGINHAVESEPLMESSSTEISTVKLELKETGRMSKVEFDENMADLTAFLVWVSDPTGQFRKQLGVWVLLFLGLFVFVAWRLNAAYWKDIK